MSAESSGRVRPHYVFVTGRLAHDNLVRELEGLAPEEFTWDVVDIGVKVAALMSRAILERRLGERLEGLRAPDRVLLPGLFAGERAPLAERFGVPFDLGPRDLRDLAAYFGRERRAVDLGERRTLIFAEIVDAPHLSVGAIVERARSFRAQGADVIDVGCLPEHPFPHLAEAVTALVESGFRVSVDSREPEELLTGARAGAEWLLSLSESLLWVADECDATPVLVPETHGDLESLVRAMGALDARGRAYLADPVLDPVLMGFTASLVRYHALRARFAEAPILMGIGNVTELFEADTAGMNAVLMGVAEELGAAAVLTTAVSGHARRAIAEADLAGRIVHAAARDGALPKRYDDGLMSLHDKLPFPYTAVEIESAAADIRDANYRIQVSEAGVHLFNRDGHAVARDAYALMDAIDVGGDWTHAFYLGVELARAETAWRLGKRYLQDNPLRFGVAEGEGPAPC